MTEPHRILRQDDDAKPWIDFMSFHRVLEILKWAAFVATLALLAENLRQLELPSRFGLS